MNFKQRYTNPDLLAADKDKEGAKIVIATDSYALCELIDELIQETRASRIK